MHRRSAGFVGLLVSVLCLAPRATVAASSPDAHSGAALKQYTSGAHVLGFEREGYLVSNGRYALQVEFVGASPVEPVGEAGVAAAATGDQTTGPAKLGRVRYADLWPGITAEYDAPAGGIARSTWHLAPGADPKVIRLRYNRPLEVKSDGTLSLRAFETGVLTESAPVAWQEIAGERRPVDVAFVLRAEAEVGFAVGAHDPALGLVIDPTLLWNTFLGGPGVDWGTSIAVDGGGSVYVTGFSKATWGTPVRSYAADSDAFAAQLDAATGALVWNTFLGGPGSDSGNGIAVDGAGGVYITGASTATWGNPVRAFTSITGAFAAQLNGSTGALVWNTFLGGSGDDIGLGIAADGSGSVYVAGYAVGTWGSPVRAYTASSRDAFVAQLDAATGALVWNTFLGGPGPDTGRAVAVGGSERVYLTGSSNVSNWGAPVRAFSASTDAFVAQLDAVTGGLVWNTFLGGSGLDLGEGIGVDGNGNVYVAGRSEATWGSPERAFTQGVDTFAAKLDASTGELGWNTFLGGSGHDAGYGIAVDGNGDPSVVGYSDATWGSPVQAYSANGAAFAARLEAPTGAIAWSTFLGAASFGLGIDVDGSGDLYVTGNSIDGTWGDPVRPSTPGEDAFVAKLPAAPTPTIPPIPPIPDGPYLTSDELPGFRFKVRITGGTQTAGHQEADCLGETLCVSGARAGRSELFVRIIGPRPNGFLWLNLVRFTTSQVEVWAEQIATGVVHYYNLPALPQEGTELTGLVDKDAYLEAGVLRNAGEGEETPHGLPQAVTFTPSAFPGFRFTVRIFSGGTEQPARVESDCIDETVCVSGARVGRSELFLRIIGPRPNGFLWLNLVRFTTSRVEVEVEQISTGETQNYVLDAVPPASSALSGFVDKEAFKP